MIVDASLLRKARLEDIARLGRSLGVSVVGLDHARAVSSVAMAVLRDTMRAQRERVTEARAQREEFGPKARRQWEQLIAEMVG